MKTEYLGRNTDKTNIETRTFGRCHITRLRWEKMPISDIMSTVEVNKLQEKRHKETSPGLLSAIAWSHDAQHLLATFIPHPSSSPVLAPSLPNPTRIVSSPSHSPSSCQCLASHSHRTTTLLATYSNTSFTPSPVLAEVKNNFGRNSGCGNGGGDGAVGVVTALTVERANRD